SRSDWRAPCWYWAAADCSPPSGWKRGCRHYRQHWHRHATAMRPGWRAGTTCWPSSACCTWRPPPRRIQRSRACTRSWRRRCSRLADPRLVEPAGRGSVLFFLELDQHVHVEGQRLDRLAHLARGGGVAGLDLDLVRVRAVALAEPGGAGVRVVHAVHHV